MNQQSEIKFSCAVAFHYNGYINTVNSTVIRNQHKFENGLVRIQWKQSKSIWRQTLKLSVRHLWRGGWGWLNRTLGSWLLLSIMDTNTHTHTKPKTVGTIFCQMMKTENRQDQSEKQTRGGVQLPDPQRYQKTVRDPQPTTRAQLITGCMEAFPILAWKLNKPVFIL